MSIITEHFDEHRAMTKGNRPANTAWFSGIVNMSVDRTVGEVIQWHGEPYTFEALCC
jgi:hypothetical protein